MDRDTLRPLYVFCSEYHSGQNSRGYRILSRIHGTRLLKRFEKATLGNERRTFDNAKQWKVYIKLLNNYTHKI